MRGTEEDGSKVDREKVEEIRGTEQDRSKVDRDKV